MLFPELFLACISAFSPVQEGQQHSILNSSIQKQQHSILIRIDEHGNEISKPVQKQITSNSVPAVPAASRSNVTSNRSVQPPVARTTNLPQHLRQPEQPSGAQFRLSDRVGEDLNQTRRPAQRINVSDGYQIQLEGPQQAKVGQLNQYRIRINTTLSRSNECNIQLRLPAGMEFIDSTIRGVYDQSTNKVAWQLKNMKSQNEVELIFRARSHRAGPAIQNLTVLESNRHSQIKSLETLVQANQRQVQRLPGINFNFQQKLSRNPSRR